MTNAYGVDIGIVYDFQTDPTPPPPPPSDPSGPPTTPILLGPTNASITVTFDVAGITGTAPLVFSALYGTVAQGPINPVEADFLQDTLYEATAIDLLPPSPSQSQTTSLDSVTKDMMKDELKSFLKKQLNTNDTSFNSFQANNYQPLGFP